MAASMDEVVAAYQAAFAAHGPGPAAQLAPKGRFLERFGALTQAVPAEGEFSVLDYGCGLAYLHGYLAQHQARARYVGADAVPEFVAHNREAHPQASFHLARSPEAVPGDFDLVVASGVFNLDTGPGHQAFVRASLVQLFAKAKHALAVDFMSSHVDYQQAGAYHEEPFALAAWAREALGPRLKLDLSYMPYEFTLVVYKDARIQRPGNVYEAAAFAEP